MTTPTVNPFAEFGDSAAAAGTNPVISTASAQTPVLNLVSQYLTTVDENGNPAIQRSGRKDKALTTIDPLARMYYQARRLKAVMHPEHENEQRDEFSNAILTATGLDKGLARAQEYNGHVYFNFTNSKGEMTLWSKKGSYINASYMFDIDEQGNPVPTTMKDWLQKRGFLADKNGKALKNLGKDTEYNIPSVAVQNSWTVTADGKGVMLHMEYRLSIGSSKDNTLKVDCSLLGNGIWTSLENVDKVMKGDQSAHRTAKDYFGAMAIISQAMNEDFEVACGNIEGTARRKKDDTGQFRLVRVAMAECYYGPKPHSKAGSTFLAYNAIIAGMGDPINGGGTWTNQPNGYGKWRGRQFYFPVTNGRPNENLPEEYTAQVVEQDEDAPVTSTVPTVDVEDNGASGEELF